MLHCEYYTMSHTCLPGHEYLDHIRINFGEQGKRLKAAEEQLDKISDQVTMIQAKVRELVLLRDDMEKKKKRLYRKMDWYVATIGDIIGGSSSLIYNLALQRCIMLLLVRYERLLTIEGIDNDTISNCIAPFTQDLGK